MSETETKAERPVYFIRVKAGENPPATFDVHALTYDEIDDLETWIGKPWRLVIANYDAQINTARERIAIVAAGMIRANPKLTYEEVESEVRALAWADVTIEGLGPDPTPPAEAPEVETDPKSAKSATPKPPARRGSRSSQSVTPA